MRLPLTVSLGLLLTACTGGDPVQQARPLPAQAGHEDRGSLRVRYQTLPANALGADAARRYGVSRGGRDGVLLVGLRRLHGRDELPAHGAVSAKAIDLQGEQQLIAMKQIRSGEYADHAGSFRISPRNTYRFELEIDRDGQREKLVFHREF